MVSLDDVAAARGPPAGFVPAPTDADTIMRMAFTSGTTGNPKGVMHSHNTTLAAARILNGDLGLEASDVMMIWLPLGLNWGYLTLVQAVLAGAKAVLLDRFAPAAALEPGKVPAQSHPLAPGERRLLLALPGQMHLEIAAAPRLPCEPGQSPPQAPRDAAVDLRPIRLQAAPEPPGCHPEVVQPHRVRRIGQPPRRAGGLVQQGERDESGSFLGGQVEQVIRQ